MKKGDQARETVKNTIIDTFAATGSFVAFQDKKIFVQVPDGQNGEIIQFAISITMPKTPIAANSRGSESSSMAGKPQVTLTELSPEDQEKVQELMRKLNIT